MKFTPRVLAWLPALAVAACWSPHYRYEETQVLSWPAEGVEYLEVSSENGYVTFEGTYTNWITAEITRAATGRDQLDAERALENIVIYDSLKLDTLTIAADMPNTWHREYQADFALTGPRDLNVALYTTNGDVVATYVDGQIMMGTTNGDVIGHHLRGTVDAWTTNGDIELKIEELTPYGVMGGTTNGHVNAFLDFRENASFDIHTTNGLVDVGNFPYIRYTVNTPHHKAGTINNGGAKIVLSSTNGHVSLNGY